MTGGVGCALAVGSGNKPRSFCLVATSPATAAAADAALLSSAQTVPRGATNRAAKAIELNLIGGDKLNRAGRQMPSKV